MGATFGSNRDSSARNVDFNLTPFIDVMSCLVAFLMAMGGWSNLAQMDIKAKGTKYDSRSPESDEPNLSVLITPAEIWVGVSRIHEFHRIPKANAEHNWNKLRDILAWYKAASYFAGRDDIEIAAQDTVVYQSLVTAMDTAIAAGFAEVSMLDPATLSAQFSL